MREYIDGEHKVTEYDNGAVVRELITQPTEPQPLPEPPKAITNADIMAALDEQRQANLDRDEMQLDALIAQEQIRLALEVAQNV